ncbi:LacI family DNA-binding transcriptional regulator [Clostridium sp. ZBS15]|uniref:LacI family DNA-binding transcriptional regulator n=1 Tax=Clostridium sp. ZBS15 TaxID=2949969 RepID=UPI00338FC798
MVYLTSYRKITTKDIADYAGVSQSTVSMVLNNRPDVSFSYETREKVLNATKVLGYEKNKKTCSDTALSKLIIIMCPSLSNLYYTMLIHSITEQANKHGYSIFIAPTMRNPKLEKHYLNMYSNLKVAGIIYLYQSTLVSQIKDLVSSAPVVLISDKNEDLDLDSVELNSHKTGYIIGEHLLSLGHKKVAYISTPLLAHEIPRIQRLNGLKKSFYDHNVDIDNIIIKNEDIQNTTKYPLDKTEYLTGYNLTKKLLAEKTDVTAFIGTNDMVAIGIMDALTEMKYKIPNDFSVCGFDNTLLSSLQKISLTTVDHAIENKGTEGVNIILKKINSKSSNSQNRSCIMRLEYEPFIVKRNSTGIARTTKLY